ncbi:MAG TPA: hypothetical protein VJS39_03885 [Gemmatimonadaceae bacterium]|nr:hypothetical protein [Gemmatimonadaceae bacterium]
MVTIGISGKRIRFEVEGIDKMWALRSLLEFPLSHIRGVSVDREAARGWWHGIKLWGSNIPGILTAGTFYQNGRVVFYDVHDPERTLVIELDHEHYDRLVVEVDDPEKEKVKIEQAIQGAAPKKKKRS